MLSFGLACLFLYATSVSSRTSRFRTRAISCNPYNHLPAPQTFVPVVTSVKVFSSLVPALLAKNLRLEVWEQSPGSTTRWTRRLSASPGNVEAIMADISSGAMLVPSLDRGSSAFDFDA